MKRTTDNVKAPYVQPRLTVHGDIRDITRMPPPPWVPGPPPIIPPVFS